MTAKALITLVLSACTYDVHFEDCAVSCTTAMECPTGLTCGTEGLCRTPGAAETCTAVLETSPSCAGLAATCGPNADEDCCSTATPIPGGTFYRSYDVASDGMYPSTSYPATVSPFVLDRFEVTVGRFRKFVEAGGGTQVSPPAANAGAHMKITGSGWDTSWNTLLATNTGALITAVKCNAAHQTWTDTIGANENLPINCVTWYDAMAFCAWDEGYLPTEAEWNYAAAGGDEQRAYPWSTPASSTTVDCSYANYDIDMPSGTHCVNGTVGAVNRVGSESPKGNGRWGQSDLAGNVWEWALDWYAASYPSNTCDDCTNLDPGGSCPLCPTRTVHGGSFSRALSRLRAADRGFSEPTQRAPEFGIRCARKI